MSYGVRDAEANVWDEATCLSLKNEADKKRRSVPNPSVKLTRS
jgi:hypothetical protein